MHGSAERSQLRRVLGNVGWVGASQSLTAASRFLILLIAARGLSPEVFGQFAFFVACSLVVANLTEFGAGRTLVRFVGGARGGKDFALAAEYGRALLKAKILLSIAVIALGVILAAGVRPWSGANLFRWALFVGVLTSFGPLLGSFFQVQGKFWGYFLAYSADPLRLVATLALWLSNSLSVKGLLVVYLLTPVIGVLLWPFAEVESKGIFSRVSFATYKTLWGFGKWLILITIGESLWQRLDVLMLRTMGSASDVGIYSGAYMFMGVAALVATSVGTLIYPRMAEAFGRNDTVEIALQYRASTNALAYLGIPCVAGIVALAPQLVAEVLGNSYAAGVSLFPWFGVYGFFLVIQMNVGAVLFAVGRPSLVFWIYGFLVVSGVAGNLALIPRLHANGAAIVLALTTAGAALLSWIAAAAHIRAWPDFGRIVLFTLNSTVMGIAVRLIPQLPLRLVDLSLRIAVGVAVYFSISKIIFGESHFPFKELAKSYGSETA